MSNSINALSLWLVVVWPLLLVIPALHSRLPSPRHLAILPAALLAVMPGDASHVLPWLMFGTGLSIEGDSRWILLMAVTVWLAAATVCNKQLAQNRSTVLFLLTLTGNLGVILAADLVGFFVFAALMGYGFYGLLVQGSDVAVRRAARLYLIFLIIADLALFEALLLAAFATKELQFAAVQQAVTETPLYLWLVFAGFVLKAGIWPFHLWLTAAFKSASQSALLLLGGAPVAMALLGMERWLPLGDTAVYAMGTVAQVVGVAALLYATLRFFTHMQMKTLPAWGLVATSGIFVAFIGTGLTYPAVWQQYEYLAYPLIAALGLLPTLVVIIARLEGRHQTTDVQLVDVSISWAAGWGRLIQQWLTKSLAGVQALAGFFETKALELPQYLHQWQTLLDDAERRLRRWTVAITLLSLLALAVALLAIG